MIKSKDPFLIRGNLATGNAIVDMKLAGTGLHPQLQGQVRLENFDATLPFSTLTIRLGFLYFDPDDPLNPRIELQGESLIRTTRSTFSSMEQRRRPRRSSAVSRRCRRRISFLFSPPALTREELVGTVTSSRAAPFCSSGKSFTGRFSKKAATNRRRPIRFFNRLSVELQQRRSAHRASRQRPRHTRPASTLS